MLLAIMVKFDIIFDAGIRISVKSSNWREGEAESKARSWIPVPTTSFLTATIFNLKSIYHHTALY